jgi:aerobic carbon-monoxide dehydrogenase small subunit
VCIVTAVALAINGSEVRADIEPRLNLADFLREHQFLTGTHVGCEHGICGACSVLLEGDPVRACCVFAVQVDGMEVTTVEGLAPARGRLSALQDAFCDAHALQCGYCTPGMLMSATALLADNPSPTEEDVKVALQGNICRCTGYWNIVEAVMAAGKGAA